MARPVARERKGFSAAVFTLLTWAGTLLMFAPVAWMLLTSFKTENDAIAFPPKLFFEPTLEHYARAFSSGFVDFLVNSLVATLVSTFVVIVLAVPAAYALSVRPVRKWRDVLFFLISTKMMPLAAGIVPLYLVARTVGLLNSTTLLVIVYISMNLPLAVWMIRSFMAEIPRDVFDAVRVDGAGKLRELLFIVMPLIRPGIASTALLCGIFAWNEFFLAVNLTTTNSTLPVFLQKFLSFGQLYNAQVAAVAILVNIPVVAAGWLAQKSLTRGLTFGAVK
ncbi:MULTISPECIES: carbohydrate ABC transporter permease [unclassified Aureimonas]|uniref:carbohydrate ABC transporter permease n=1 Tax=unclassified Aureimonas TaxID=2615206 RepID=UPI0006F758BD|nr:MULTISPECIES: carbohydrate ABC transporter permease [unclassified Aureimonas]KQT63310.1 sugar ABC transporter permease [Aureimonas sp. Leaf427]KQT80110.1 sugar ABC transporter permease [Aureimonas sp. Leaf460]